MYSDRIVANARRRRDLQSRLGPSRDNGIRKRLRGEDDKWVHDLYQDADNNALTVSPVQKEDLRARLSGGNSNAQSAKSAVTPSRQFSQTGTQANGSLASGDLRRKLMRTNQTPAVTPSSMQRLSSVVQDTLPARTPAVRTVRTVTMQTPTPAQDGRAVATFLQSLGLGKYIPSFQAEEVDMAALRHMTEEDLKELGVPMGPRKKIMLALKQ
ncbi:hypothetical protein CBR_g48217 [Chara braunii]|uniref:SAM domain-containing protein n=1 Tax=Chara braunii TaxID=69332 RepID=A0A388M286_CHABU|nr:hypothetical protein CBR_g48217 [Chara braunii]|eukprot:GBG88687.1 hypothetical protein CBR_g48217 [Chara braunii]